MRSRKPKWSKWNLIDDAEEWQVVALSLDIDPDLVTKGNGDWMAGGSFVNHEGKDFKDRLDIISANYQKFNPTPHALRLNNIGYCELNIPKFAKWALSVNLEIPPELAALASTEDEAIRPIAEKLEPETQAVLGRRDQQLEIILAIINALDFEPLKIPDGGKAKIKTICLKSPKLFSSAAFDHAWKVGLDRNLFKLENAEKFKP